MDAIDATIVVDDGGVIVEANAAAVEMIGRGVRELVGAHLHDLVRGIEVESVEDEIDRADAVVSLPDGDMPVHAWRRRLGPDRSALILRDATEWRATQATLAMVVAGVEQGVDAFEITDERGNTEYANPALEAALGRAPFDILGEPLTKFLAPDDAARVQAALLAGEAWRGEVVCRHASGDLRQHEMTITPVVDMLTGMRRFVVVRRDVTARVAAERQLEQLREHVVHADRLSVLGQLAASVAHDVNNPATFILTNVRLALDDLRLWHDNDNQPVSQADKARLRDLMDMLRDAIDGTERVIALVKEMRSLGARAAPKREPVKLADVAHDAVRLTRVQTRAKARVVEHIESEGAVLGDRLRLGQVVVNLLMNAAQAIPDGAESKDHEILVSVKEVSAPGPSGPSGPSGFVELSVSDTGVGIKPEDRERVFEAWFTTKKREEGSGLGLAISRQIVADLGGTLTASPRGDGRRGSVFTLRFPCLAT